MSERKHSRSYHRYFENYAERETIGSDGRPRIQRVYVGQYYTIALPASRQRHQKLELLALFVLGAAGYMLPALLAGISAVPLAALCTMPPLIALIFWAVALLYRLFAPSQMEIRTYRDASENLLRYSLAFSLCTLLCLAATLAVCLAVPSFSVRETLPALVSYATAAVSGFLTRRLEKSTPYQVLSPRQERPPESSPIRYEMPE